MLDLLQFSDIASWSVELCDLIHLLVHFEETQIPGCFEERVNYCVDLWKFEEHLRSETNEYLNKKLVGQVVSYDLVQFLLLNVVGISESNEQSKYPINQKEQVKEQQNGQLGRHELRVIAHKNGPHNNIDNEH